MRPSAGALQQVRRDYPFLCGQVTGRCVGIAMRPRFWLRNANLPALRHCQGILAPSVITGR